jgi:hypothetical protein
MYLLIYEPNTICVELRGYPPTFEELKQLFPDTYFALVDETDRPPQQVWQMIPLDDLCDFAPYPLNWFTSWNQLNATNIDALASWYKEHSADNHFIVLLDSWQRWTTQPAREQCMMAVKEALRVTNRTVWFTRDDLEDVLLIVRH